MTTEAFSPEFSRIVPEGAPIEKIAGGFMFTEGPVWNGRDGHLTWTDIIGDTIWRWTPGEGTTAIMSPTEHANGLTLDLEGRLLVAGWSSRTVWRWEHDGTTVTLASHYDGKKLNTPNDIVVKSDGSIYFTDSAGGLHLPGHQGHDLQRQLEYEGVFRLDPETSNLTLLVDDMVFPNGLCFSEDERILYVNDSRRAHIRAFEVRDDGTLNEGPVFTEFRGTDPGIADGMKVDVEGNVYCTGPGAVYVMDPQGNQLGRIRIPEQTANFGWGGGDWRTLYFTARTSVYRMKLNIQGVPVYPTS